MVKVYILDHINCQSSTADLEPQASSNLVLLVLLVTIIAAFPFIHRLRFEHSLLIYIKLKIEKRASVNFKVSYLKCEILQKI